MTERDADRDHLKEAYEDGIEDGEQSALLDMILLRARAEAAEAAVTELRGAALSLISAIEHVHGPLDGSVSHGGQKVDGLRCDEPFSVRVAMRRLAALAISPQPTEGVPDEA